MRFDNSRAVRDHLYMAHPPRQRRGSTPPDPQAFRMMRAPELVEEVERAYLAAQAQKHLQGQAVPEHMVASVGRRRSQLFDRMIGNARALGRQLYEADQEQFESVRAEGETDRNLSRRKSRSRFCRA